MSVHRSILFFGTAHIARLGECFLMRQEASRILQLCTCWWICWDGKDNPILVVEMGKIGSVRCLTPHQLPRFQSSRVVKAIPPCVILAQGPPYIHWNGSAVMHTMLGNMLRCLGRLESWNLLGSQVPMGWSEFRMIPTDTVPMLGNVAPVWVEQAPIEQDDRTNLMTTLLARLSPVSHMSLTPAFGVGTILLFSHTMASTSKASTSKTSTSKTKHPERLGYLLYTLIWAGEHILAQQTDEEDEDEEDNNNNAVLPLPLALHTFRDKAYPPLWLLDCPGDCKEWKDHWKELRKKFPRGPEHSNNTLKAKFGKSDAETFFAGEAVKHRWLTILDTLWGYIMLKYVKRAKATAGRQQNKYDTLFKKIMGLLGENFLMGLDNATKKFTPWECIQVIKLLRQCSETLDWEVLTKDKIKQLATPLAPVTPESIAAFNSLLTGPAKKHEYIARFKVTDIEVGIQAYQCEGYQRGQALADLWSFSRQDPSGRNHTAIDEDVMQLLTGSDPERGLSDWLDGGEDLGHIVKEWKDYKDEKDVEIPGKTMVFTLWHHQLVAIVTILQRAVNPPALSLSHWPPKQCNMTDVSPLTLWRGGRGGRAAYARILTTKKFKFGPCDEIPNAAHIVVVPGSLLGQWGDQLICVYRSNAVAIKVIQPAKKHWEKDMEVSPNVLAVNTIFVIRLTTLVRMAKEVGITGSPPEFPTLSVRATGPTVFNKSFGVCITDEAHKFRKGSSVHQAMMSRQGLFAPSGLTVGVDTSPTTQLALVKKIRSQSHADRAADLEVFMNAATTEAATEGGEDTDKAQPLMAVEKAQRQGVERLKAICLRHTIRRTGKSMNPDGTTLTGALPRAMFIHVVFELSEAEIDQLRALEETNITEGKLESTHRVDAFYNEAWKYMSYPPGKRSNSCVGLHNGPEMMVATALLGTQTKIIQASAMGLPNMALENYQLATLEETEGKAEKAVVFTHTRSSTGR
ncbi:hypothetical protein C8F04DRAFT_1190644 [Mycena alexandri]|uniref:Uncharacterized protein n=1 Tax=Mycena alexandri TaxID=1745969 RepID=A0AAD6SE60_9AGAR|nr:hypothetical protein C8F04DRAFT_1190644 [Mycena alexandri]